HQHVDRLAEHHGLGLDSADAPAENTQTVDHRRVRVCPHQTVRVDYGRAVYLGGHHASRQKFQVDLVHNTGRGRDHGEIIKRGLAPAQEFIALAVAFKLAVGVDH